MIIILLIFYKISKFSSNQGFAWMSEILECDHRYNRIKRKSFHHPDNISPLYASAEQP